MLANSFKTKNEYKASSFSLPRSLNFENFEAMIKNFKILTNFKNTLIVTAPSVLLVLFFSTFAAYAFSKLRFKRRDAIFLTIICTMFIPIQITIIPLYYSYAALGIVNTHLSVILTYLCRGLPGAILLLTLNFRGIPDEIIEAGRIDGAGYFRTIRHVIVPMGSPALAASSIMQFVNVSNDLFTPMILLQKMELRTMMVALTSLMSRREGDPAYQMAGFFLCIIPSLIVYLAFQPFFVKGLTFGSFK